MRIFYFWVISLIFVSLSFGSKKNTDPTHVAEFNVGNIHISTTVASTDRDLELFLQTAQNDFNKARKNNQNINKEEVSLSDAPVMPTVKKPIGLAILRGVINGTVVSWSLLKASDTSLSAAIIMGITAGGISMGFMLMNEKFQAFLDAPKTQIGKLLQIYKAEWGYLGLIKALSLGLGVPQSHDSYLGKLVLGMMSLWTQSPTWLNATASYISVFETAALAFFAQGFWEVALSIKTRFDRTNRPDEVESIQRWSNVKVATVSVLTTALSVLELIGVSHADIGLYAIGGAGVLYYLNTVRITKKTASIDVKVSDPKHNKNLCEQALLK